MSSLLEQAIIDAAALKEAAVKNAEAAILNKYSADIKEVVENLFEQEEEELDAQETEVDFGSQSLEDSIPQAIEPESVSGESEIVLSMEELKDMAEALSEVDEDLVGEPSSHEELASEIETEQMPQLGQEEEVETTQVSATLEEEIEVADLEEIIEELVVDINPQKSGWAGTPEEIMQYKEQMRLAQLAATEAQEENQELVAARDRLSEQNDKLKETVRVLKEKFDQVSLSNAKFLYTNRVLTNNSLNERQKAKIVEALSNADSINDAKVIFETLESAVGSVTGKARPQSLRETIERPTATLPRREAKQERSPVTDRMQILAGIKKLK
jgi:hypothetical protein